MNEKSFFYRFATSRVAVAVSVVLVLLLTASAVFRLIEWWLWAAILVLTVLGFVIYGLVRDVLALRRDEGFERAMDATAEAQQKRAQAGERAQIAELHERWKQGIEKLRASRAGRSSKKALYFLPWYLIIGNPGTGKTCAIKHSGLHFPLGVPKTAGTGGTRNCDWFFAEEAILLDTAGRFTASEDDSADRREWIEFLGLVQKYRRDIPINGLLVAVAADELLASGDVVEDAHTLRTRLEELITELKIQFPVYVLVTKCDLVPGFSDFFGALPRGRREELLGWTNPSWEMDGYADGLREALDEFLQRVTALRPALLRDENDPRALRNIFIFPERLEELNDAVTRYCDVLFRETRYNESPFLRGVYFSSALQTGSTIEDIVKGLGLADRPLEGSKSYFLTDLFDARLKEDDRLVAPTGSATMRLRVLNNIGLGLIAAACVLVATFATASYLRNRTLLNRISDSIAFATALPELSRHEQATRLGSYWTDLETLRARVSFPDRLERFGLFKGEEALPVIERAFLGTYETVTIGPALESAESALEDFIARAPETRDTNATDAAMKAFGAISEFVADSRAAAANELESGGVSLASWWDSSTDQSARDHFASAYRFYLRDPFRADDQARQVALEGERGRRLAVLRKALPVVLNLITIETWLEDPSQEVRYPPDLVDATARGARVRAAYTHANWKGYVEPLIASLTRLSEELGNEAVGEFETRYQDAYFQQWGDFLDFFVLSPDLRLDHYCSRAADPMDGFELFRAGLRKPLAEETEVPAWTTAVAGLADKRKEYAAVLDQICAISRHPSPCDLLMGGLPFAAPKAAIGEICRSTVDLSDPEQQVVARRCHSVLEAPVERAHTALVCRPPVAPQRPKSGSLDEIIAHCNRLDGGFWRDCERNLARFINCESCARQPGLPPAVDVTPLLAECRRAKQCAATVDGGMNAGLRFDVLPVIGGVATRLTVNCSPQPFELVDKNNGAHGTLSWALKNCNEAELSVTIDQGGETIAIATAKGLPELLLMADRTDNEFTWRAKGVAATLKVTGADGMIELAKLAR